uniref:NADH-ubiquinone oxidoreductase chain 6 n=1 Tax=Suberites domuncula TaxID=55567 RepID=B1GT53_SUBDO|nr:NADH dehydrogenase subunit 6 [Suberites domuncula]CAM84213.1 NADH dehydrogenase subunit 6 [Suberites domuncula]
MEGLFYLFAFGVILSGIMVISALNPVHSVFWLIVAFTSAALLFILLEVEFIAFIFLIVYVGAIAILFLFVIMMLNLTDLGNNPQDMSNYMPTGLIIGVVVILEVLIFSSWKSNSEGSPYLRWDYIEKTSNIEVLGRVLYTDYYYLFILASFILLSAMIGAIVLTQTKSVGIKRQDSFTQVSRQEVSKLS